ncbi:peptide/nickel transport system substrate-binding protein [Jiangella alba]|uniref:Peptide/nickel transport system substrate-binding protein n=1 Tax=Jiangella alba TaxID=561176 RepID=A0A1H5JUR3_9ACTN|nr:peptide/nickel transport system substrate-binding protein [Jiangella alba]
MLALAYDVLIYQAPDGSLQPQLATSWEYVGDGNTTFELSLRPDIAFVDGTPLDAQAVKANLEYRRDPAVGSQSAAQLAAVSEVEVVDDLTVRIHLATPNPLLPSLFTQSGAGAMISPAALADPAGLATETFGVGRYQLDASRTVHGDHYTFVSNPDYWSPDDVHWDEVVVSFLPEESAALASLQAGQLDAGMATSATVDSGRAAGLSVAGPGFPIVAGLNIWDRDGEVVPALGDVRVRQALNYAVDREAIASALVGDSGSPTDQLSAPDQSGWNDDGYYPYDPDKARELLAEAGYADGFTLPVRTFAGEQLTQAIADNLGDVGVVLEINADEQMDQADDAGNSEYGAGFLGWGISPPVQMATYFWLPDALNNPADSLDDTLVELHQQALVADEKTLDELNGQIVARVAELAWFLPVYLQGESVLYDADVVDVPWANFQSVPTVTELRPASSNGG